MKKNSNEQLLTVMEAHNLLKKSNTLLRVCQDERLFGLFSYWAIGLPKSEKDGDNEALLYATKFKPNFFSSVVIYQFEKTAVEKLIKEYPIREGDCENSLLIKKY